MMPQPTRMVTIVEAEAAVGETIEVAVTAVIAEEEVTGTTTVADAVVITGDPLKTRTASSSPRAKSPSLVTTEVTTTIGVGAEMAVTVASLEVVVAATVILTVTESVAVAEAAVADLKQPMEETAPLASNNSLAKSERRGTRMNKVKCE